MEKNIYLGYWPLKSVLEVELFCGEENYRGNLDFLNYVGGLLLFGFFFVLVYLDMWAQ